MRRTILAIPLLALFAAAPALAVDGAALYAENCVKCHGEDGNAQTKVGKAMKAKPIHAGAIAPEAVAEHVRNDSKHKSVSSKLSDEELAAISQNLPAAP